MMRASPGLDPAAGGDQIVFRQRIRNMLGGSTGHMIEIFDWVSFNGFAIYFSAIMFPNSDQTSQLLQSYVVFAIGFLARPLGAFVMGLYADSKGRRPALVLSVALMCIGSLSIGLMPTYAQIGLAAPVLLTVARIAQGFSMGGEYGSSSVYVCETAPAHSRGFWSGIFYVSAVAAHLLVMIVQVVLQALLTESEMYAWGWRVPFLLGGVLALVVYWIRVGTTESPSFLATKAKPEGKRKPGGKTWELITRYPREFGMIVMLTASGGGAYYFYSNYLKDFLINSSVGPAGNGFSASEAALINTWLLVIFLIMQPITGALSDRFGRKLVFASGFGIGAVIAYPTLVAIQGATSMLQAFLFALPGFLAISSYTALGAVVKAELYPAHIRVLGVAMPFAITTALVGGNIAVVALSLKKAGHESVMFWIITGLLSAGFLVAVRMRDSQRRGLILEE